MEPEPPPRDRVALNDATVEELQSLLASHPRGLLCVRDELSGWLGNLDRYGGNGGDRAFFLEAWNGGSYNVDRVKHRGSPLRILMNSLAILGGIQPDRVKDVLSADDDALVARFGFVWPDPVPIVSLKRESSEGEYERQETLIRAARRLHALKFDDPNSDGRPEPRYVKLSDAAFKLLDRLHIESVTLARSSPGVIGGWHGKSKARAIRLALVYEHLTWAEKARPGAEPQEISGDAMARACSYIDYLGKMFERTTAGLAVGQGAEDAKSIAAHIQKTKLSTLHPRNLYREPGWRWLRDKGRREPALSELVDAEWIRRGREQGSWDVNPRVFP